MKAYQKLIQGYKLVIWDGKSNIKCTTGVFTAEQIKKHWNIGIGVEVFYIVKGRNKSVPFYYGTNLMSIFDSEDIVECGKLTIKNLVEQEYRDALTGDEQFIECPLELLDTELLIVDERIK